MTSIGTQYHKNNTSSSVPTTAYNISNANAADGERLVATSSAAAVGAFTHVMIMPGKSKEGVDEH